MPLWLRINQHRQIEYERVEFNRGYNHATFERTRLNNPENVTVFVETGKKQPALMNSLDYTPKPEVALLICVIIEIDCVGVLYTRPLPLFSSLY